MRFLVVVGLATLAWAVAPGGTDGAPAPAAGSDWDSTRALRMTAGTPDDAGLRLGRAVLERRLGNLRGVVENLAGIDFATEPSFAEADRAAFLLGQAYLELGARERFVELARDIAAWKRKSHYTRWMALQGALAESDLAHEAHADRSSAIGASPAAPRADMAEADALAAALLLRDGDPGSALRLLAEIEARGQGTPITVFLQALALDAKGADDAPAWTRLAGADTTTLLGRELAGAALIRLATRALARGDDPTGLLGRVPAGSRYRSRARHMMGLAALERGDTARGREILAALADSDSTYGARREVRLALAGLTLDRGRWQEANQIYQTIERDRDRDRGELERLREQAPFDSLWSAWEANAALSPALILDALAPRATADRQADAAEDLGSRAEVEIPPLALPARGPESPWSVPPPPHEVWKGLAATTRDLGEAEHALLRAGWAAACERETLDARRRYLGDGLERAREEALELARHASLLDSLRNTLAALDARLKGVRDEATRRILHRSSDLLAGCAKSLTWMLAMRHFHLDGPNRLVALPPPAGTPGPDSVLAAEESLARALTAMVQRMAAEAPGLIARSYERAWRPGLIERAVAQDSIAHSSLSWARALETSIDSTIAASSTSDALRRLMARAASLEQRRDSLQNARQRQRDDGARAALERALTGLEAEREAIDYGLAASAYGLGVRLGAPGVHDSSGIGNASAAARDSARRGGGRDLAGLEARDELDDPEAARWRSQAIALHQEFLARHPSSPARGETRFRLADLLLVDARAEFRQRMERYMNDQATGATQGAPLPVLSHAPALALYRSILAEDPEFEHRDAALFNAGMILADEGSPEAESFFSRLVQSHPQSSYCQEAYVRMGDMQFDRKRYAESVPLYRRAAGGADPSLQTIALYKLGWAHYNADRFMEAADAFGSVLDLYGSGRRIEIQADVEGEAEAYLVHSLASAGGARAFREHFGRVGSRRYETGTLLALGQHFRRFGLYEQAAEADELYIERYPTHADALLSAQRLVDTRGRANLEARVREARLSNAARFAPGSPWFAAQTSDSVRAAGSEFARASMKDVAQEHHQRARRSTSPEDWRAALEMYERVLATWPRDPDVPSLALKAGEAAAQLGRHATALAHYATAASGPDSIAAAALWQRVAVTDAWYESTRAPAASAGSRAGLGRDSLALAVFTASDELLKRFPGHPKGADLTWRQGNLAFAHGWLDRSAQRFSALAERYPDDPRALRATVLRGDAWFRAEKFEDAGRAYEAALGVPARAGADSLRRRAAAAVPVAYYRHAEAAVAEDSTGFERHAQLFEQVAARWPKYEHAPLAQYRAGLAYLKAGKTSEGARAMQTVIDSFPRSEYVRDAHLQIAKAWEASGDREKSAESHARFAQRYSDDPSAADAWLKSADLYAAAGKDSRAEELRLAYIQRYPHDVETAMEVYEGLARRELASLGEGGRISSLLPAPQAAARAGSTKRSRATGRPAGTSPAASSRLAEYLRRAQERPDLASRPLMAQVRFLQGEEARPTYEAIALRLPLPQSIAAKQKGLDRLMGLYRPCVDLGVPEWTHAATFRIGEALVGFGEALERSERPADLTGDALRAYEGVLHDRGSEFAARGEAVWSDLLRKKASDDPWIGRAQEALWHRLGGRFHFRPEVDYPLVAAEAAGRKRADREGSDPKSATDRANSNEKRHRSRGEETSP